LIIANAIREDVGSGDYSSLACIPASAAGKARLFVKDQGIIAGVEFAKMIFNYVDPNLQVKTLIEDGTVKFGDVVFEVAGSSQSILKSERLVLNSMQRMSAIATKTNSYVQLLEGTKTKILDTAKPRRFSRVREMGGEDWRRRESPFCIVRHGHAQGQPQRFCGRHHTRHCQNRIFSNKTT
jgi:nicotinate-nucleotide pyrophosphorylase (carboxylating)